MKRAINATLVLLATAAVSWGAVALDITKPPVTQGSGAGPNQDPNAIQGQWFAGGGIGAPYALPYEFHDNVTGSGGGLASSKAIEGYVTNLVWLAGPGTGVVGFTVHATVTNDTPTGAGPWANGVNSHGEIQNDTTPYVGNMWSTRLVAEFALTDLGNQPNQWISPYTQMLPEIIATNETDQAWYCFNQTLLPGNPGNYYVPAWDFGSISMGQSVSRDLTFAVNGVLAPGDSRYAPLVASYNEYINQGIGLDILMNRTTSLKISNWVDGINVDTGVPYPWLSGTELNSNASVFFIPEASTVSLLGLLGLLGLRRRR